MIRQPIKTDNLSVNNKIFIRKQAIKNLSEVKVLDLFAGRNVLWKNIKTDKYFGIDNFPDKGKNLVADTHKIISSINLPDLFNARAIEFFYELLGKYGIKEVYYYETRDHFTKHYGYFKINI